MKKAALIIAHFAVLLQCAIVMSLLCQMKRTHGHDLVMLCEIIIFILTLIQLYLALDIRKREKKLEYPLKDSKGNIIGWTGPYKTYPLTGFRGPCAGDFGEWNTTGPTGPMLSKEPNTWNETGAGYTGFTGSDAAKKSRFTYINGKKKYF